MGLESLLTHLENNVTHVTAVQPSNGKAYGCNGKRTLRVTDVTCAPFPALGVTAVTSCNGTDVTPKPAQTAACTPVTAVTSKIINADLKRRILAMAERWHYTGDELALVLEYASQDPVGWLKVVEADERGR